MNIEETKKVRACADHIQMNIDLGMSLGEAGLNARKINEMPEWIFAKAEELLRKEGE